MRSFLAWLDGEMHAESYPDLRSAGGLSNARGVPAMPHVISRFAEQPWPLAQKSNHFLGLLADPISTPVVVQPTGRRRLDATGSMPDRGPELARKLAEIFCIGQTGCVGSPGRIGPGSGE